MDNGAQATYVIHTSSLVEVLLMEAPRARVVLEALVEMAESGRLRTVLSAWEAIKDERITDPFAGCSDDFVVDALDLGEEIREVVHQCPQIVPNDPMEELVDVELAALGLRLNANVVCEPSGLGRLPGACNDLQLECVSLARMLEVERV